MKKDVKKRRLTPCDKSSKGKKKVKYPRIWEESEFKFKYFKVKTAEGGGVLHIIFRKSRDVPKIPYEWLSNRWPKIWGSWNVSISQVKIRDADRLAMYMVGQYFAKQPVLRMSYGRHWIGQGVKQRFMHLIEVYGYKTAVEIWTRNCRTANIPTGKCGFQKRFIWKKLKKPSLNPKMLLYPARTLQTCLDSEIYLDEDSKDGIMPRRRKTIFMGRKWYRASKITKAYEPKYPLGTIMPKK
jgi:hypothetical protein